MAVSVLAIGLDMTVLTVALPTLATDLRASTAQLQWFANGYTLALAAAMLPAGALADRIGAKRLLVAALALFGVASVACAYAVTPAQLVGARVVLGVAAAMIIPVSMSLVPALFPPAERARALGLWITANALGMPVGPLLGGWLLDHYFWGSVFLINVPVVVVAIVGVQALVPRLSGSSAARVDLLGVLTSAAGLAALTYGLIAAGEDGWGAAPAWAWMAVGVALLLAFGFLQRSGRSSLVDASIFADARFRWAAAVFTIGTLAMMGVLFTLPQYLQSVRGLDSFGTGLRLLPLIAGLVVGARVAPPLAHRAGVPAAAAAGLAILGAACAVGSRTGVDSPWGQVYAWTALAGLGLGTMLPGLADLATSTLDDARTGSGTAVLQSIRQVGATLGVAVLGSALGAAYRGALDVGGLPADAASVAREGVQQALVLADLIGRAQLAGSARAAFVDGMARSLLVVCGLCVVAAIVGWLTRPRETTSAAPVDNAA